jgi:hypothetical protein
LFLCGPLIFVFGAAAFYFSFVLSLSVVRTPPSLVHYFQFACLSKNIPSFSRSL